MRGPPIGEELRFALVRARAHEFRRDARAIEPVRDIAGKIELPVTGALRWNEEENRCTHRRIAVPAIAPTPRDIVPAHFEMMLQVDVEDPLMEVALERYPAEGTVVICLDLKFRCIRYFAAPSAENITSQDLGVVTRGNSFEPPVGVALQGEFIP